MLMNLENTNAIFIWDIRKNNDLLWAKVLKTSRRKNKQNWKSLVKKLMKYVTLQPLLDFMFIFSTTIAQA